MHLNDFFKNASTCTKTFTFLYGILVIFALGGRIILTVLDEKPETPWIFCHWTTAIVFSVLLIFGAILLIRKFVRYLHKKFETGRLRQLKNELIIGFGGVSICGLIPRILVYFLEYNSFTLYYFLLVFLSTIIIFYCLFIHSFDKHVEWIYPLGCKYILAIFGVLLHIFGLFITMGMGLRYMDAKKKAMIAICQFIFSWIFASGTMELGGVLLGLVKLKIVIRTDEFDEEADEIAENLRLEMVRKKKREERLCNEKLTPKPVVPTTLPETTVNADEHALILECKICMQDYNETRVPRLLKECGHTVCEVCAEKLLEDSEGQILTCPFCQKFTIVNGSANLLPKNFTMMELIDMKKA